MNSGWYHELCPKFLTSIPKSGTYLMRHILRMDWPGKEGHYKKLPWLINGLTRLEGIYRSPGKHHIRGHLICTDEVVELTNGRVAFFLYRDPRDLMVSWAYYIDEVADDNTLVYVAKGINLKNSRDRIFDLIKYLPGWFERYLGWLDQDVIPIRYEGLINSPARELEPVAEAIPEPLEYLVARSKMRASPTYRRARPGNWREEFKPHHRRAFEKGWAEIMDMLGYD